MYCVRFALYLHNVFIFYHITMSISRLILLVVAAWTVSYHASAQEWGKWEKWGDMHDGTYRNPILPADFSDVDCIEVDGTYYMISSTFQFQPGMIILKSHDMVNWETAGYAVRDIRQIDPAMNYDKMDRYGRGIWAGAIRYNKGRFYIYFGTPDEGYFMTSATTVAGPWDDLTKMSIGSGWDDPCPFFDDDGKGYLVGTDFANGYKTYLFDLASDYRDIIPETARLINEGNGREANKLYKYGGYYYHLFSEVNQEGRQLMIQRASDIGGPYSEARPVSQTGRQYNEPNQGGFLTDSDGHCFFLTHHGTGDWSGRAVSLLPVTCNDGWPIAGKPADGSMVWQHAKPSTANSKAIRTLRGKQCYWDRHSRDDKAVPYGEAWEWNYYPRTDMVKRYGYRKGHLHVTLGAFKPLESDNLLKVGNVLTTRSWRTPQNRITIRVNLSDMTDGQTGGICHFSASWSIFGIRQEGKIRVLYFQTNNMPARTLLTLPSRRRHTIFLRSEWGLDGLSRYSYSFDGVHFHHVSDADYTLQWGNYRGDRLGLFTYNDKKESGWMHFTVTEVQH